MAEIVTTKAHGLYLQGNSLDAPEGSLVVADNVVIGKDDVVEPRRGHEPIATRALERLLPFKGGLLGTKAGTISDSLDGVTWTDKAGTHPAANPVRLALQNGNAYLTSDGGLLRVETLSGAVMKAGVPVAPQIVGSTFTNGPSQPFANNTQAAYRFIWCRRDANGNLLRGAPSGRVVLANTSGGAAYPVFQLIIPAGLDASYFAQVYRSRIVATSETPDDELSLTVETPILPMTATVTNVARVGATVTATTAAPHGWTSALVPAVYLDPGHASFARGSFAITVTGASTFTYAQAGAATSAAVSCTASLVSINLSDTQPDSMRGAALYTNETQEGELQANERIAAPVDVCSFRDCLIFAAGADWPRVSFAYLGGLQAADTLTVNGTTYTFGVEIALSISADVAVAIEETARSIVLALNLTRPAVAAARYVSSATDVPGKLVIEALNGGDTLTVSVSRPSSFSTQTLQVEPSPPNILAWSKKRQPDAVPLLNRAPVGSADDAILRVIATRDHTLVLKGEDGVWRLAGDSPETFRIDPLDLNTKLVAPETAVALDNRVVALTEQGVVAVTSDGTQLISRQEPGGSSIEDVLEPLLAEPLRSVTAALAYAIAYESQRLYIIALPTEATDTTCTQAYAYNLLTRAWTRWPISSVHGIVNPADDRLYLSDGARVLRERKDFAATDYADDTVAVTVTATDTDTDAATVTLSDATSVEQGDVIAQGAEWGLVHAVVANVCTMDRATAIANGAATLYKAIETRIEWVPRFAPPGNLHHFVDAAVQFSVASFSDASIYFATELTGEQYVQIGPVSRAGVPREAARGGRLHVGFYHRQGWTPYKLQAVRVRYIPGKTPARLPRAGEPLPPPLDAGLLVG